MPPIIQFNHVSKDYAGNPVLTNIALSISENDFMVIYGLPSSGKSVLLRLLMGLEKPDQGEIILRGQDVTHHPSKERKLGYIPQDFALFPQKNIFENIAYPLRLMRYTDTDVTQTVQGAAEMLNIGDLLHKLPTQLSGGQKQRVAIARGIVKKTDIYIFDDPLAGLDFKLREKLFDDLTMLQQHLETTFIYTTSDPLESMSLAKTVAVLHGCRIQETGSPEALYLNPMHLSTMEIFGFPGANLIPGTLRLKSDALWCQTDLFSFQVEGEQPDKTIENDTPVTVSIRSENIRPDIDDTETGLTAKVLLREDLGAEEIVYLSLGADEWTMIQSQTGDAASDLEETIGIKVNDGALFVFDAANGERIGKGKGRIHV